jgi:DNA-binding transcriptional LysR family regulator
MDTGDLRIFEAVARLGGMNRAAAELNTVQSNITARIRHLEASLGETLFQRHSRGVALTPAGQRLLPYARRAGHLISEARRAVADDGRPKGELVIGSLETTAAVRLPQVLSAYAAAHPDVDLVLRPATSAELIEDVLAHRIEGAFVCGPVDHPDLVEETVFVEELVLVTSRRIARLEDLSHDPRLKIVVMRIGCSYRQKLEGLLAAKGIVGLRRLEFGTIDGIVGAVGAGLGVSLLPRSVVAAAAREGRVTLHAFPPDEAEVSTVFVRRRDAFVSSALRAFLDQARPAPAHAAAAE